MTPLGKPHRRFSVQLSAEVQAVVPTNTCRKRRKRVPEISLASGKRWRTDEGKRERAGGFCRSLDAGGTRRI